MLSESIFQTMTTSMMMSEPSIVEQTFHSAKKIDGIEDLNIAKSKAVIEVYSPQEKFTTDPLLIDVLIVVVVLFMIVSSIFFMHEIMHPYDANKFGEENTHDK